MEQIRCVDDLSAAYILRDRICRYGRAPSTIGCSHSDDLDYELQGLSVWSQLGHR